MNQDLYLSVLNNDTDKLSWEKFASTPELVYEILNC